jgi:hypothetical protein
MTKDQLSPPGSPVYSSIERLDSPVYSSLMSHDSKLYSSQGSPEGTNLENSLDYYLSLGSCHSPGYFSLESKDVPSLFVTGNPFECQGVVLPIFKSMQDLGRDYHTEN